MAPLPVIADTYRVAFNWTNNSNSFVATNVMHFRKGGGNPAALWTALDAQATAGMWNCVSGHGSVNEVIITPLDGSSVSFPVFTGKPAKWTGNAGSSDWIPQSCAIVKFLTAKRGRSYRGRIYLPWVNESEQSVGILTAGSVTAGNAAWVTWLAAMIGTGYKPVVASYLHATADDIIAVQFESLVATQRRRMVRQ